VREVYCHPEELLKQWFVILSEAKDLITKMSAVQILRFAQDDKVVS
jgi:hypothetical protein